MSRLVPDALQIRRVARTRQQLAAQMRLTISKAGTNEQEMDSGPLDVPARFFCEEDAACLCPACLALSQQ